MRHLHFIFFCFTSLLLLIGMQNCRSVGQGVQLDISKKPFERLSDYQFFVGKMNNLQPNKLADRFENFYQKWKSETALLSSGMALVKHPAYLEIMKMGDAVVPFILIKLLEDPHHLFYAFFKITGENPVPKKHAGNLPQMTADWLEWGKRQGYLN